MYGLGPLPRLARNLCGPHSDCISAESARIHQQRMVLWSGHKPDRESKRRMELRHPTSGAESYNTNMSCMTGRIIGHFCRIECTFPAGAIETLTIEQLAFGSPVRVAIITSSFVIAVRGSGRTCSVAACSWWR
jgi:hypothetical protein